MPLSDTLASLTFTEDLDDGDLIADVVVLARVTRMDDGQSTVFVARTEGTDIVTVMGLLECGRDIQRGDWERVE